MAAKKTHDASASESGYLFQCRCALLAGVQAMTDSPDVEISIEKLDDVAFESHGEPTTLIQTKHHIGKIGNLSDASVDLWKTLLIWAKRAKADVDSIFRIRFVLMTTASAPDGSAASFLRLRDRNEAIADNILMKTAAKSRSQENAAAYGAYSALPDDVRLSLLRAVAILDGSPNILDVHDEIVRTLYHAANRNQIEHLVERLEGWWFGTVIKTLSSVGPSAIPVLAIDQRVDELREEFKRDALPVDLTTIHPPAAVIAELDGRPFVKQLRMVEIGTVRIEYAIRDYYRASEQRSRWAREDLLLDGELASYERELVEAWEPRHAAAIEGLTPSSPAEKRVKAGQAVFAWAEQDASFPLRSLRERFLTHGSYHMLSNRYAVGWHPDFKANSAPDNSSETKK